MESTLEKNRPSPAHPSMQFLVDLSTKWVAEDESLVQQLLHPAVYAAQGQFPLQLLQAQGPVQCKWALEVLKLVGGTSSGPDPIPCEVDSQPYYYGDASHHWPWALFWAARSCPCPSSPQDGSNACPATRCSHPRARQGLMQRPVSRRQKPAFTCACFLTTNHSWKKEVENVAIALFTFLFPFPNHVHTLKTQPDPNLSLFPLRSMAGSLLISARPVSPTSLLSLKRHDLMSHVTNNGCKMPVNCGWPSSSKIKGKLGSLLNIVWGFWPGSPWLINSPD